jgi:hypothetical protein
VDVEAEVEVEVGVEAGAALAEAGADASSVLAGLAGNQLNRASCCPTPSVAGSDPAAKVTPIRFVDLLPTRVSSAQQLYVSAA